MSDNIGTVYPCNEIKILTGIEAIRKRPGMYIGTLGKAAPYNLLKEALCIPRAYARAGDLTCINITVPTYDGHGADMIQVQDNGPGLPVCKTPLGKSKMEAYFEDFFACADDKLSEHKKQLCTYGLIVVNALCETLFVQTVTDRKLYVKEYEFGEEISAFKEEEFKENTAPHGTNLSFIIDEKIIQNRMTLDGVIGLLSGMPEFKHITIKFKDEVVKWSNP